MLFDNPIFSGWYTDTMDIYRVVPDGNGNVDMQERKKVNSAPVRCRVYAPKKDGLMMTEHAARERAAEKMACDLTVDIRAGDMLLIVRGGGLGLTGSAERYFAGVPVAYYDPVGGALTGLDHKEVGLLRDEFIS